jgi:hypothetical protein
VLRIFVGESSEATDRVVVLETNLDDCPGERLAFAMERLFDAGAVDVSFTPITMKKSRPGVAVTVIAPPAKSAACEAVLFRETGTFGLRKRLSDRVILHREIVVIETPFGDIRGKRGRRDGNEIVTPEYDDCARVARDSGAPLRTVFDAVVAGRVKSSS